MSSTDNCVEVGRRIAVVVAASLLAGCGNGGDARGSAQPVTPPPIPEISQPGIEADLLRIVSGAQKEAKSVENDMQLGGVKARRDREVCQVMTTRSATNWIGKIKSINSNSDGKGVLEVEIAPDVLVKTWNNDLSDIGSNTLIEPGTPLFESASRMKHHQKVLFSGHFLQGSGDECIRESSLTLRGKVKEPEFLFVFSEVRDYEDAKVSLAKQQTRVAPPAVPVAQPTPESRPATMAGVVATSEAAVGATAIAVTSHEPTKAPAQVAAATAGGDSMTCDTTKHQIVVDRDPVTKLVRYRSWNRPKEKTEKPDMEAKPGEVVVAGTGDCRSTTYRFTVGNARFELTDSVNCGEARPPENAVGQLGVYIKNELRSEYWCLR